MKGSPNYSSTHPPLPTAITITPTVYPMLCSKSPWLFCNY